MMHKLTKGLKKKKKQKKGKKGEDDEEFDPEELERYRQKKAAEEEAARLEAESGDKPAGGNEEWKKFQALTSGIDTVLKKTQDDLDRIKSTSFYQRKVKEPEPEPVEDPKEVAKKKELAKRYKGFDKDGNPIEITSDEEEEKVKAKALPVNEDGLVEISDDEEDHEDSAEEDIFDTTYLDELQNIDVQLAYIPDSPTQEELGDDPFDTSNADKVLKVVDKTGKKLVSLGNAVEVLAGRIEQTSTCKIGRNRPRPKPQDLLDIDAEVPIIVEHADDSEPVEVEKTLLDDDSDLPDIPIDLTQIPAILTRPVTPAGGIPVEETKPLDISEFEIFPDKTLLDEVPTLDDEEFDLEAPSELVLEEAEDPFAEKEPEVIDPENEIAEAIFEVATFVNEEDPFDTTIAENIVPGKTELKFIERELENVPVSKVSISLTDPRGLNRNYETGLLKDQSKNSLAVAKKDLLGGSNTDLSQLADKPIQPVEEISYVDPFDTSNIRELPPGKTELKVLEKELLGESKKIALDDLDDDDFDPRAEESPPEKKVPPPRPPTTPIYNHVPELKEDPEVQLANKGRKPSRPEALEIAPKVVAFELPNSNTDFLAANEEEKSLPAKPLTPYYPQKSIEEVLPPGEEEVEEAEVDPFDTSYVAPPAPCKTELKIIESELHSLSDNEFDPRSEQVPASAKIVNSSEVIESLIQENKRKAFGKRQDSILDTAVEVNAEPLAPTVKPSTIEEEVESIYKDPFDTSHATNIGPGKIELKLLENELSQVPDPQPIRIHPVIEQIKKKATVEEDPDFDPREDEPKQKDILCLDTQEEIADKILTPIQDTDFTEDDIDPFDTSFASIGPGKTELKLLESELIDK